MSSAKVANTIDYSELKDVNIKINEFQTSDWFQKQNMERGNLINNDEDPVSFKTPVVEIVFGGCKESKYESKNKKYDFATKIADDDFYDIIDGSLKKKFIGIAKEHHEKLKYDNDEEILEEYFQSSFNKTEKYGIIFNAQIQEIKYKINFDDIIIDENDKPIKNPDFEKLLVTGTKIIMILEIPHMDFRETRFGPKYNIMKIKIVSKGEERKKDYINKDNYDINKFIICDKQSNDKGGTFCKIKYNHPNYASQAFLEFNNKKLVPFAFENFDKMTGNPFYGVSYTVDDEDEDNSDFKFLNELSDFIVDGMVKNSKDYLGSKKTKKQILSKNTDMLKYSKEDKELVKKGESPKYKPRLDIGVGKYDNEFKFKFFDKDGSVKSPAEFGDFKTANPDTRYNIKCYMKHLWFGTKYSVKLILDEISIVSGSESKSFKYSFGSEIESETNVTTEEDNSVNDEGEGECEGEGEGEGDSDSDSDSDDDGGDEPVDSD
jgi:hypothetical protein